MIANKYINLAIVHGCVIIAILFFLYIINDIKKVEQHFEECRQECYPAKIIERFSYRGCFCDPNNEVDDEDRR